MVKKLHIFISNSPILMVFVVRGVGRDGGNGVGVSIWRERMGGAFLTGCPMMLVMVGVGLEESPVLNHVESVVKWIKLI